MSRREGQMHIDQQGRVVQLRLETYGYASCQRCVYYINCKCAEREEGPVDIECEGREYWVEVEGE